MPIPSAPFSGAQEYRFPLVEGPTYPPLFNRNSGGMSLVCLGFLFRFAFSVVCSCANLQIIALHDYNLDPSYVASHIDAAKPLAMNSGKRMIYEEFGATGSNKQSQIQAITNTLISVRTRQFLVLAVTKING